MKPKDCQQTKEYHQKKRKKGKIFLLFIFGFVTLFLCSFSATTFILMNSYRLTFAGENDIMLQQELGFLKNEVARKENEIEELKLQLANLEGESSFVNQMEHSGLLE